MFRFNFAVEVLKGCKEKGVHTAVETAGYVPWENLARVIPYTDLYLYDVKHMNLEKHLKFTGGENKIILENLSKLVNSDNNIIIRNPVIPGFNNTVGELNKIAEQGEI